ncbi:hypothetical protein BT96DRAFT_569555 [Gymnopus androsaceus JB14]|uniref:Uncharacterized protein n=1 Tax=Gymnopus androsaceus JB14 TaxID=1447944 RepID=A0A6A4HZ49_9AGAR|nr:hypothetical protein BT96DRAFT_569555 [Gymnopus androsaceus JB14]
MSFIHFYLPTRAGLKSSQTSLQVLSWYYLHCLTLFLLTRLIAASHPKLMGA